jgi:hypothetical protein
MDTVRSQLVTSTWTLDLHCLSRNGGMHGLTQAWRNIPLGDGRNDAFVVLSTGLYSRGTVLAETKALPGCDGLSRWWA